MILEEARRVLTIEGEAVLDLREKLGEDFVRIVEMILENSGRVIVSGVGKSGLIGRKIAATLASTGTPAFFLHPTDALHGDVGVVTRNDIFIALSHSGETEELLDLVPVVKRLGARLISFCSRNGSRLGQESDIALLVPVREEACPLGLAPTASSTATLALGDALAMALLKARDFSEEDFARFHPSGRLGRRLLLRVSDVLKVRERNPRVSPEATIDEALLAMTSSRMGAVSVVDEAGLLVGIITDGDIRRSLSREGRDIMARTAEEIMTADPMRIDEKKLAAEAVRIMEEREIGHLPVVDKQGRPLGLVNYQDLFQAGVV